MAPTAEGSGPSGPSGPTGRTRVAAVIGSPVGHSLSPAVHNAAFAAVGLDWVYVALEVAEGQAPQALVGARALGLAGLSVTTPHKEAVAEACDDLSGDAAALGAVNCVEVDGARLVGHSTDGEGFVGALRAADVDPSGRRVAVLGAGGAARAIAVALARSGAERVGVVNRTPARAERAVALLGRVGHVVEPGEQAAWIGACDLVVNATSVGMGRSGADDLPLDPDVLHERQVVADIVYDPLETALLRAAAARGARTLNGVPMLVHQAAAAFTLWTGVEAPLAAMGAAADAALAARTTS